MPTLDISELNVVISVLGRKCSSATEQQFTDVKITGAFIILYGFISVKIKQVWYLGEACKFLAYRFSS